ncbi:phosphatase PAP2 family protein [Mucilaginibacter sp.]|uniref:phosphatase PAP2 family protein n=1 Tax=Mucilaginibacter sp. TaxID=1882438 RepID=UPI003D13579E
MHRILNKRLFFVIFISVLISCFLPGKLYAQSPIQQFDDRIMIDIQNTRTPEKTGFLLFMSNTYRYGDIGIPAAMLVGGIAYHNEALRQNSLFVASSTAISYGLMTLIKHVVKRRRPFIQNINIVPVYRAGSTSFPSGHAASTFATATALSMAYPKWYIITPAFLWAGTVSYSRMYLGVHYPTDVAAGIVLGAGTATSLMFLKR